MSDDKKYFYANAGEVAFSGYDISLKFVRTGTVNTDLTQQGIRQAQMANAEEFSIIMSPQYAKSFIPAFKQAIEKYEEMFGKIPDANEINAAVLKASK